MCVCVWLPRLLCEFTRRREEDLYTPAMRIFTVHGPLKTWLSAADAKLNCSSHRGRSVVVCAAVRWMVGASDLSRGSSPPLRTVLALPSSGPVHTHTAFTQFADLHATEPAFLHRIARRPSSYIRREFVFYFLSQRNTVEHICPRNWWIIFSTPKKTQLVNRVI